MSGTSITLLFALPMLCLIAVLGWRTRKEFRTHGPRRARWLVLTVLVTFCEGLCATGVVIDEYRWSGVELGVMQLTDREVAGEWSSGERRVSFAADHRATLPSGDVVPWSIECCTARVRTGTQKWLAIRIDGELRLLENPTIDPDEWEPRTAFRRQP